MPYEKTATTATPALIIYLLDMSSSMESQIGGRRKIDVVSDTLYQVVREIVVRSTKGRAPAPRYRVAIFVYNDQPRDVLGGPMPITEVIKVGVPAMNPSGVTNTAAAFEAAEQLLITERSGLAGCPAPLVCHLTDGAYTGSDPLPVVERIRQMTFPDGAVLVENIFFDGGALRRPIDDPYAWSGVASPDELTTETARRLFAMSSPIPTTYRELFADRGYTMSQQARLMFPGDTPEIMEAAFTMSGMTPVA
jgi:hypothetical protein